MRSDAFILTGGLDVETPYLAQRKSGLLAAQNYEQKPEGGYRRIKGYSLFDGQDAGQVAVTGSGPTRCVFILDRIGYAIRDNAGATAGVLHKQTGAGWVAIDPGYALAFTAGTAEFVEGETVTGFTSGATGTIQRIAVDSGTWGGSDAAGRLYIDAASISGTFVAETITSPSGSASGSGAQSAIAIPPGGTYDVDVHNFYGSTGTSMAYLANGVGKALEFYGDGIAEITTGAAADTPSYVRAHKEALCLGFVSSVVISGPGEPHEWTSTGGAAEIAIGRPMRGLHVTRGGVLFIMAESQNALLYGNDSSDWSKRDTEDGGSYSFSAREVSGTTLYAGPQGIQNLAATQAFGDFDSVTLSQKINKFLLPKLKTVSASGVVKSKDQYRVFFSDGSAFYLTVTGREVRGVLPVVLEDPVLCTYSSVDVNGDEFILAGSNDGKVFRMESSNSFNGSPIVSFMKLPFWHMSAPHYRKRFRQMFVDGESSGDGANIVVSSEIDFNQADSPSGRSVEDIINSTNAGVWGVSVWGQFEWGGSQYDKGSFELEGTGENISLFFYNNGQDSNGGDHSINSIVINYDLRGNVRH